MPIGPYVIPRLNLRSTGVDFLGLREVNLAIREQCLPGFSNATVFLRAFSVMCWIYWKFHNTAHQTGMINASSEQMRAFREKAEVMFTWSHRLNHQSGLPGITFAPPPAKDGRINLTFEHWHRIPSSTGLMAAVNYGPALKAGTGLNLLQPLGGEFFQVIGEGIDLAEALDEQIRKVEGYQAIASLDATSATESEARSLYPAWAIAEPSAKEREAFQSALYDPTSIGSPNAVGLRSATIRLILDTLVAAHAPLTENAIRRGMFSAQVGGYPYQLEPPVALARRRWIALQVRQAQRLALQSLLTWIEKRLLTIESQGLPDIERQPGAMAVSALKLCLASDPNLIDGATYDSFENNIAGSVTELEALITSGLQDENISLFGIVSALQSAINEASDAIIPHAFRLLALCARYTVALAALPEMALLIEYGGTSGLSMTTWRRVCDERRRSKLVDFFAYVMGDLVLSQHFAVAAARYDGGAIRLRISIEEEGLRPILTQPWEPHPALDKLGSCLSLMADCGLIFRRPSETFAIT